MQNKAFIDHYLPTIVDFLLFLIARKHFMERLEGYVDHVIGQRCELPLSPRSPRRWVGPVPVTNDSGPGALPGRRRTEAAANRLTG